MTAFPENATAVLVHGAWADGYCWSNIILPLKRSGLKVICPPLPLTSLTNDTAALNWALERTTGLLVLVGHAYSGAVIAQVREERVKSLVCIAALAPDEGETVAKMFYRDPKPQESPKLAPDSHDFISIPEVGFHRAVAQTRRPTKRRSRPRCNGPLPLHAFKSPRRHRCGNQSLRGF